MHITGVHICNFASASVALCSMWIAFTTSLQLVTRVCFACMHAGENHFETVEDLVTDGLITLFMEEHHVEDYINQGPKLVRQPAVYTRRRSAHLMKYQATGQNPLKENTGM